MQSRFIPYGNISRTQIYTSPERLYRVDFSSRSSDYPQWFRVKLIFLFFFFINFTIGFVVRFYLQYFQQFYSYSVLNHKPKWFFFFRFRTTVHFQLCRGWEVAMDCGNVLVAHLFKPDSKREYVFKHNDARVTLILDLKRMNCMEIWNKNICFPLFCFIKFESVFVLRNFNFKCYVTLAFFVTWILTHQHF